jgi:transcriptional regulator GlxA family with amidase domain
MTPIRKADTAEHGHNRGMHIAILTFQGFNELDSLVALGVLNRIKKPGWRVTLCCPEPIVTSMNGVIVHAQSSLSEAGSADAVIVGSGRKTREIVNDPAIMSALRLDPTRPPEAASHRSIWRLGSLLASKVKRLPGPRCTMSHRSARRKNTSRGP